MNRNFFIGSIGKPGEGYDDENWERCIALNAHVMHEDTKQKGVFDKVTPGDICFLKYKDLIIAFGEVTDVQISTDKSLEGWTYIIKVDEWYFYSEDKKRGVSKYGIAEHTYPGAGQMGTIKQLYPDYGLMKMQEIGSTDNILYKKVINDINMEKLHIHNIELLIKNYNLILTGAPGTGKTYLAKQIAAQMILGCEYDKNNVEHKAKMDEQFVFVQFHPSFDYTDFVEGLRPVQDKQDKHDNIGFKREDGIFMAFCRKALNAYNKAENEDNAPKYIFVIDEINRGELSKIFGELFFSIDPGYRGSDGKVKTQYSNLWKSESDMFDGGEKFFIPKNVYIIGTMNDIDRSVESMDFAMRRRFAFQEIDAQNSFAMIEKNAELSVHSAQIRERMESLNNCILTIQGLNTAYQIGAAYFLKLKNYLDDSGQITSTSWNSLWDNHIKGLLFEYLRGLPNAESDIAKLKDAYDLNKRYEVVNDKAEITDGDNE